MPSPRKFLSVKDMELFIDNGDGGQDAILEVFIEAATAWIESYCNRTFESVTHSKTYDGDNGVELFLGESPVTSITSVEITTGSVASPTTTELDSNDYVLYEDDGRIVLVDGDAFSKGNLNVAVTFNAGKALPGDVKKAAIDLVRWYWRRWNENREGISSISAADVNTTYETDVPKAIRNALDRHRRLVFA